MIKIGVSQRVDEFYSYKERRDSLDQKWSQLLIKLKVLPVPLPNLSTNFADQLITELNLEGILLTGGNSLSHLEPDNSNNAPERDLFEKVLIKNAINNNLPVIGVCRGMQVINDYFGGGFNRIHGHVATNHAIRNIGNTFEFPESVNSYHEWGIPKEKLGNGLIPLADDYSSNIEAFKHKEHNIYGIMWHPERGETYDPLNIKLLKRFLS